MTHDPLLPVRLVDGVWTTEGAGSAAVPTDDAPPSTGARNFPCDPYPPPAPRSIFAALHPRGYLYALGDTEADARENALSRRDINRDEARSVGVDFPPPETDTAWADELIFVTVSGTTESLRVYVASVDDVIPWCPADLWDNPTPPEEP